MAPILAITKKISFLECHVQDKVRSSNLDSSSISERIEFFK